MSSHLQIDSRRKDTIFVDGFKKNYYFVCEYFVHKIVDTEGEKCLLERDGRTAQKSISSPLAFPQTVSPRSAMERRGLWIRAIMKRPGPKTGELILSSCPNN
jgi:hypothetical protein